MSRWSAQQIQAVAQVLNARPRKSLGWKSPAEALNEHLFNNPVLQPPIQSAQFSS